MPAEHERAELDPRHYLRVLRRRKWVVVLAVIVVVGTALTVSLLQTPVYQASADLLIQPAANVSQSVFNPSNGGVGDPIREIQTQIQIITSRPVKDKVNSQLGATPSITARPVGQTDVIRVTASSTIPKQAADVANAYANAYISFRRTQDVNDLLAAGSQIQTKVDDLQKQIDALDMQVAGAAPANRQTVETNLSPQRDSLVSQKGLFKQRLDQMQVDAALKTGGAQLVTPAVAPMSPSSPKPVRNGVLGLLVGLVFGVGLAVLLDHLDDSVRSSDDLDLATHGLPNLGLIPKISGWKAKDAPQVICLDQPTSAAAEAYRTLRTSIQFMGIDHPSRLLQVTSPNSEEGKTTTLANLGVALARAGQRVCICCCDLRRPRIHEFFGLDNATGFTSVILGDKPISAAVQTVAGVDGLFLLASGPLPPNPSELLASDRAAEVFRSIASMYDMVLIDAPPILPVTDAAVIARLAEGTILIASAGSTTRREIGRAIELLRQVDAPLIGAVLNGVTADTAEGYYRYSRYYGSEPEPERRAEKLVKQGAGT
jgi:polysaccharide biosynthesis transport protein